MSFFGDIEFFICLTAVSIPAIILGILEKPLKLYGFLASLLFIILILGENYRQIIFLGIFYATELALVEGYAVLRRKYGRNPKIYSCFVLLSILPVILGKISEVSQVSLFQFLGLSYLTFRVVQMIIEIYDGVIEKAGLLEFSAFLLFFPTFSCGPIDRSRRFSEDWNCVYKRGEYLDLLSRGLVKLLMGIAYKFVFAVICYRIMGFFGAGNTVPAMIGYAYSYGFYMFFDFAGYSLMAIGASYLLGVKTPDNFNKPFLSRDIKDFWNRWHITLSHWFRDFIFTRFMMKSIKGKWFSSRLSGAVAGFVVNMFVMGLWHGLFVHYVLYGLYHGVLLAATEIYQKKSKFYAAHKKKKWYSRISWFVTLNLVMFGFLLFSGKLIPF